MTGGSDPDPYRPRGPQGPDVPPDCDTLDITVALSSLDPAVVATLTVGDEVAVCLEPDAGGGHLVVVRDRTGGRIGTIAEQLPNLLPCLQRGKVYAGEITRVDGGNVRTRVTARALLAEDVEIELTADVVAGAKAVLELRDTAGGGITVGVNLEGGADIGALTTHSAALISALNRNRTFGITFASDVSPGRYQVRTVPRL